ncbi:pfs domain protein [Fusarium avenaceum]|nr:pfs domain protein [Fusarium avenaceum]
MGTTSAATVANQMKSSFPALRCALLVGIGGGIPSKKNDIRLGDVVIGVPGSKFGAVVQWDCGKTVAEGKFVHRGILNDPPAVLLAAVNTLRAQYNLGRSGVAKNLEMAYLNIAPEVQVNFQRPSNELDVLFESSYDYDHLETGNCQKCDLKRSIPRKTRNQQTIVHFGTIASGNQVIKHGPTRDEIGQSFDALCLEMEAAGIVKDLPCIVIRGICDYSDSHKNKDWQSHAAIVAAAAGRDLLSIVPSHEVNSVLDPGYLYYPHNDTSVRISRMDLRSLAPGGRDYWQDYWHTSRILKPRENDADYERGDLSSQKQVLDQALRQDPDHSDDKAMETKLAGFIHEYRAALLEVLGDFPDPGQRLNIFQAMLRMTKGQLTHDGDTGRTLLHWLAMNGVAELLPKLVNIGFEVKAQDSDYQTPLHLAVIGNHSAAVKVLVEECGADLHIGDLNGLLPWHHALHIDWDNGANNTQRQESKVSIIRFLATVTPEEKVKGSQAHNVLSLLKSKPNADIRLLI